MARRQIQVLIGLGVAAIAMARCSPLWAVGLAWQTPKVQSAETPVEQGPDLIAPQAIQPAPSSLPGSDAPRVIVSEPPRQMPIVERPEPALDPWADDPLSVGEPAYVPKPQPRPKSILRAAHTASTMTRQVPPSAFSGTQPSPRPVIRSTPPEEAPAPPEELPPPRDFVSPNTDQLLMSPPADEFELDGGPTIDGPMAPCNTCGGPSCRNGSCWHDANWLQNLSVFGGPQAFKGPPDIGRNGNFGFHEGVNWGAPFWLARRIGYQVGGQVVHSNFSGSNVLVPTSASRTQFFLTAGIFQRAIAGEPWQWGVAYDWLADNYYVNQQLSKLRAEVSFVGSRADEVGFWTSLSLNNSHTLFFLNQFFTPSVWTTTDLYAFFYRRHFANGGNGRLWGGFSGNGEGMVGGDFRVPMSNYLAFEGNANYLIPKQGGGSSLNQESWAMMFNLVLYIGGGATTSSWSPWRPLFNVADNSVFMIRTK